MGDAEEVDIGAVGNLLLHGDARDTSSSRFVGASDARVRPGEHQVENESNKIKRRRISHLLTMR